MQNKNKNKSLLCKQSKQNPLASKHRAFCYIFLLLFPTFLFSSSVFFFSAERISLERQPISPTLGNVPFLLYKMTNVVCIICRFGNTYGYGFAFGLSSPYTPLFNMALFRLQKDFKISSLSHKWTKEGVKCEMMDNFEKQQQEGQTFLTLEAPISICIFSLVFSIHFLWY